MLLKKEGFPQESELVICTVTKIQFNSVFARLDEYETSGMIHISEISPGRIRNIRDYVKEGKVIVCVVLRINRERGHIDLSLRRVNDSQRRKKIDEMKQEQRAEKILEFIAKNNNMDVKELFNKIWPQISDNYDTLYQYFEDFVAEQADFKSLKLPKNIEDMLVEVVSQRIKLPEVEIEGEFRISSHASDGVEVIKQVMAKAEALYNADSLHMSYLGDGRYDLKLKAGDYKEAEEMLKNVTDAALPELEKKGCRASFKRKDN